MSTAQQATQAICHNGHRLTTDVESTTVPSTCGECGSPVLTSCPACGQRIVAVGENPPIPINCASCAQPFPWSGRVRRQLKARKVRAFARGFFKGLSRID